MDILLLVLPESGDLLVVYPDGRAIRIAPDGAVAPPGASKSVASITVVGYNISTASRSAPTAGE